MKVHFKDRHGNDNPQGVLAAAYNLLFEMQKKQNPSLTFAQFNQWLGETIVNKYKAAKGKK